jgi:glycerate kinase
MNRIVIASDSFKGTFTSMEVADSVEKGIRAVCPDCDVVKFNVADGGEGTMSAICESQPHETVALEVSDPLGRRIIASYAILGDGTAVVEMSGASGLTLLTPQERNPLNTSTYGTGEIIADALSKGCRRFLIGIGGSATNDAGIGMLSALGYRFLDDKGQTLPCVGGSLGQISSIDTSAVNPCLKESEFTVACDVDSPLYGPSGAAYVFAPQKGASDEIVTELDAGLRHFAELTGADACFSGAGAAGGLGFALKIFMNANLERGIDIVLDRIGFDQVVAGADLVITGEGCYDGQTSAGKTVHGVISRAGRYGVPVIVIAGSVGIGKMDADVICAGECGRYASARDIEHAIARYLAAR